MRTMYIWQALSDRYSLVLYVQETASKLQVSLSQMSVITLNVADADTPRCTYSGSVRGIGVVGIKQLPSFRE